MKKILLALVAIATLTGTACAQESKNEMNEEQRAARRLERLSEKLDLTAAQQAQVKDIMAETGKRLKELEAQKRAVMEAQKTKIEQVLTPEQLAKFKEMKPGRHGKGGFRGKGPRHGQGDFKGRGPRGKGFAGDPDNPDNEE